MVTAKAALIPEAKNQTLYMVENHWYSKLMNISKAPKVRAKAAQGIPAAEIFPPNRVQRGSPSLSCVKEIFLSQ